ncbi:MAG: BatD family protein [Victivallales bacterium]|nr:BatD family protein [Victivallales bacterium]
MLPWICLAAGRGDAPVRVGVDSQEVSLGEVITFQIQVESKEEVETPVFPKTDDFTVTAQAPSRNSSTSVQIINGRVTREVHNQTLFNYQLIPKRTGRLQIPRIAVTVEGKKYITEAIPIRVGEAEKVHGIELELQLSSQVCYVGQPVVATWKWYVSQDVRDYSFSLPLLAMPEFTQPQQDLKLDKSGRIKYQQIPLASGERLIGILTEERREGIRTTCITFQKPLIPNKPGNYLLDAGTVTCQIPDPRLRRRSRDPFFDSFFSTVPTRTVAVTAPSVTLEVRELPSQGKPSNFTGLIGKCHLQVTAKPTDVNVGDPIVLTIRLEGLPYPDNARIPELAEQPSLAKAFRVSDQDTGSVQDGAKVFQCTLRATTHNVTEIPPVELPVFDSEAGQYVAVQSKAIPIQVHAVKTITASDAQGVTPANIEAPAGIDVKSSDSGIAHNYEWNRLLANERLSVDAWLHSWKPFYCAAFLALFLLCAALHAFLEWRNADPATNQARHNATRAYHRILSQEPLSADALSETLQDFLRASLRLAPGTVTFDDVRPALEQKHIPPETLSRLQSLFDECDGARFAGQNDHAEHLQAKARELLMTLRKSL